jgi:hypothetical protein
MTESLTLVSLSRDQIEKAKAANGSKRRITHAVICGGYGQLFGTEKQCRKYFSVWSKIFPRIFARSAETETFEITDYRSTFNLVMKLIEANDARGGSPRIGSQENSTSRFNNPEKKGFLARLFRL